MFNFFRKKDPVTRITDRVVIDEKAKLQALLKLWQENNNSLFIFWFEESLQEAENFFAGQTSSPISLLLAREVSSHHLTGQLVIFAEHYPMQSKEQEFYTRFNLPEAIIYSSLREPLFQQFGGDKIVQLMLQLGMKEDEIITNSMITKAIQRAQEKIEKKVLMEQTARSQKDWLQKNITA